MNNKTDYMRDILNQHIDEEAEDDILEEYIEALEEKIYCLQEILANRKIQEYPYGEIAKENCDNLVFNN